MIDCCSLITHNILNEWKCHQLWTLVFRKDKESVKQVIIKSFFCDVSGWV